LSRAMRFNRYRAAYAVGSRLMAPKLPSHKTVFCRVLGRQLP